MLLTTVSLLDALKADLGGISDYQAARRIGVSKATISAWRSGSGFMSDENAHRVAEMLRLPPMYVIACINLERADYKNTGMQLTWKKAAIVHHDDSVKRVEELLHKELERARDGRLRAMAKDLESLAAANGGDAELSKAAQKLAQMARRAGRTGASVLLAGLMLFTAPRGAGAAELTVGSSQELSNLTVTHYAHWRRRRLGKLARWIAAALAQCLKSATCWPLQRQWATERSTGSPRSAWHPSLALM